MSKRCRHPDGKVTWFYPQTSIYPRGWCSVCGALGSMLPKHGGGGYVYRWQKPERAQ
ncbi:hypothetical protein M0R72_13585 [Candidatus Pacearchaeota archaeon]|jgi:hypothetical protein|nr:hypothetical protein [Candidatus Pacearchaeota archaeon]